MEARGPQRVRDVGDFQDHAQVRASRVLVLKPEGAARLVHVAATICGVLGSESEVGCENEPRHLASQRQGVLTHRRPRALGLPHQLERFRGVHALVHGRVGVLECEHVLRVDDIAVRYAEVLEVVARSGEVQEQPLARHESRGEGVCLRRSEVIAIWSTSAPCRF